MCDTGQDKAGIDMGYGQDKYDVDKGKGQDRVKEMANLRKSDRREKVLSKMNDIAKRHKNQEAVGAKQKKVKVKDTVGDSEPEKEVCQLAGKKDEDNTDSVFLPPEFCISPVHPKRSENPNDRLSDVGSYRNPSICSRESGRNNSFSSNINSNVPSANQSPALPESRYDSSSDRQEQHRLRSPSFHDYRRWRRGENRSYGVQDFRTVRIQDRLSPSFSDKRSASSPSDSINEFRILLQPGQERSSTVYEPRMYSWNLSNTLTPITNQAPSCNAKSQLNSDMKQTLKTLELKQNPPATFHVVDEDAIL
ncbi:hypothetical protein Btru_022457 [Bulinus truncatus]|nr:hypothetical protein Btru_022457 [Bulinus truncatus]